MRGERQLLRLGEYLVGRACRRLPEDVREERYREWVAELPAILHDPQAGFAPRRAARMLAYAADTERGAAMTRGGTAVPRMSLGLELLFLVMGLVGAAVSILVIVQAPGDGQYYLNLAWSLLFVAYFISRLLRAPERVTTVLMFSFALALEVLSIWQAAEAPGDWVNDFNVAVLGLVLLTALLFGLRVRWFRRLLAHVSRA